MDGSTLGGIALVCGIIVGISVAAIIFYRVWKKREEERAIRKAKALALKNFEDTYGEIHTNVEGVLHTDGVSAQERVVAQRMVNRFKYSLVKVNIPEGGKIEHNVNLKKK